MNIAKCGRENFDIGMSGHHQTRRVTQGAFGKSCDTRFEAFDSKDHVCECQKVVVEFVRCLASTASGPERLAIVEIVRNDRTGFLRRLHRLRCDFGSRFGKSGKYSTRVKPAGSFGEDRLPVDVAKFEFG